MFENDQGSQPNLWVILYFIFLITAMFYNLYNFHQFQENQEEMAARIEDLSLGNKRKVVIENKMQ